MITRHLTYLLCHKTHVSISPNNSFSFDRSLFLTNLIKRLWKSDRRRSYEAQSAIGHYCILPELSSYIDEFLLPLIIGPTSLVLEDHIVIPSVNPSVDTVLRLISVNLITHLRLILKSVLVFSKGLPSAMSCSRAASSSAALSRSCIVHVSHFRLECGSLFELLVPFSPLAHA